MKGFFACAFFVCIVTGAVLIPPVSASAHSIFIQSGRYLVKPGQGTPLFFCFGHHFPVDEAVRREKLHFVKVITPEKQVQEVALRDEKSLHSYVITYDLPGTYVLTAETNPGYFAMYTDKKGRKRHSLQPLYTFADKAQSIESSMRSSQWAKTYVTSDTPSENFPAQVGLPFELVPDKDPGSLLKGDEITFTVYVNGKQYTGEGHWDATYAGFSTEAEDMYFQRTVVTGGTFTIPIEEAGRWFVRFFTKTPAPEEKKELYLTEKRTATITFEVRNTRKRPKIVD